MTAQYSVVEEFINLIVLRVAMFNAAYFINTDEAP